MKRKPMPPSDPDDGSPIKREDVVEDRFDQLSGSKTPASSRISYTLKNGKSYAIPSHFIHLQSGSDVNAMWYANLNGRLDNIGGMYAALADYMRIRKKFDPNIDPIAGFAGDLRSKPLMIDPAFDKLLTGSKTQKNNMFALGKFDSRIRDIISEMDRDHFTNLEKTRKAIDEIYHLLPISSMIDVQIRFNTDIIISPCVPLSSKIELGRQYDFVRQMLLRTRELLDSSYKRVSDSKDLMNVLTVDMRIFANTENFSGLYGLLLCNNPDHIGIKVNHTKDSFTTPQSNFFHFFRHFNKYAERKTSGNPPQCI